MFEKVVWGFGVRVKLGDLSQLVSDHLLQQFVIVETLLIDVMQACPPTRVSERAAGGHWAAEANIASVA